MRLSVRFALWLGLQFGRLCSRLKFLAYFPEARSGYMHWTVEVKYPENIHIGSEVVIGPGCVLGAHSPIWLGDCVRLSKNVVIETAGLDTASAPPFPHVSNRIVVGKGAWIGTGAIVLGGVTIGEHAVIGAGAVVTHNVPSGSIFVGAAGRTLS